MTVSPPRALALATLLQLEEGNSANAALDQALAASSLDQRDRGLVTELVDGTLRWQGRLDYQLQQLLDKPLQSLPLPIKLLLRMSAYQMTLLERIPAHAAVHDAVTLARKYGHEGTAKLVNAVLRRLQRDAAAIIFPDPVKDPVGYLSSYYSHPAWLVARWLDRFGFEETTALLQTNNITPPVTLRVNRRWITRDGLQMFMQTHGVETVPTEISPWGLTVVSGGNPRELAEYHEGLFTVQGEGSMVMVELLRPGRRRKGWDLTAGVGGKTTHLAEWVDDTGELLATDTSADRLQVLKSQLERLQLTSVEVTTADARNFPIEAESLDYALLDAPCSGSGSLRRQADARWKKEPAQLTELVTLQYELLQTAAKAVKPGGFLLYCTCSLEEEENQQQIFRFLAENPAWSQQKAGDKMRNLPAEALLSDGSVQLLPHKNGTDGFFATRLQREPPQQND